MADAKKRKVWALLLVLNIASMGLFARINPQDGSILSQVHIMFEWDDVKGADRYELTIYQLKPLQGKESLEKVVTIKTSEITWLATQGLTFGSRYQWRVRAFKKQRVIATGGPYHFEILQTPQVMPDSFRTDISYTGNPGTGVIFLDRSAMAIDKKGKPVWFLPVPSDSLAKWVIRDLKLTAYGTITHLDIHGAYEKDLTGKVLWQAPDDGRVSGDKREEYHHEMKKNNDGTYWVSGSFYKTAQQDARIKAEGAIRFNTVIHYNTKGDILWSWNEWNSLLNDSLFKKNNHYNQGGHLNGFAYTQDEKKLFVSFKNLSDVYLYDIAAGKFTSSLKQSARVEPIDFQQQHGPYLTTTNELMIYNNNIVDKEDDGNKKTAHPSVMIFRYDTVKQTCSLVWQYEVQSAKYPEGIMGKEGYVSETKAGTVLVCTGGTNYAVEVNRQKQKLWECYFYYRTKNDTTWKPYSNYRCQSASSLYPLYFTLQYAGVQQGKPSFRLHNAGSEASSFTLLFADAATQKKMKQQSKSLLPGESQLVQLPNGFYKGKALACSISPNDIVALPKDYLYATLL